MDSAAARKKKPESCPSCTCGQRGDQMKGLSKAEKEALKKLYGRTGEIVGGYEVIDALVVWPGPNPEVWFLCPYWPGERPSVIRHGYGDKGDKLLHRGSHCYHKTAPRAYFVRPHDLAEQ